ncbi:MAG TPA: S53 family peptidase, partial [Solirubrobacteraceae bacterium]|nr:S53 family peptidase [Solirubrobacteraceae bacterium]
YTAAQIGDAYGMDTAWNAGDLGAGTTVALVELEPFSASDVASYQSCAGTNATVQAIPVDGGSANCWQSGPSYDAQCGLEDVLDIEDVAGLAPAATIHVYEGPNTGTGLLDVYQSIVQSDVPVISTSWGACEAFAGTGMLAAENTIFQEAAVQGEAVFAAAGDAGTDDCQTGGPRAVDDPASQPFVTGVGGTSMPSDAAGYPQSVWNNSAGAGGGGVSRDWALPSYQSGFARAQSAIGCSLVPGGASTSTNCREVPDVSANADPLTGYDIYWTPPPQSSSPGGWIAAGGTSAAAPTWASLVALADSSSACTAAGIRVGFANALLYGLPASDFNDVTQGGNGYDGLAGYGAGTGYDMASGRGTPNGAALLPALCGTSATVTATSTPTTITTLPSRPEPTTTTAPPTTTTAPPTTTTAPPTQTSPVPQPGRTDVVRFAGHRARRVARVGRWVRLVLRAWDRGGLRLFYSSRRLPRGLRINHRTGLISGRPRRAGRDVSSITARDSRGDSETIVVRWLVRRRLARAAPSHRRGRLGTL